MTDYTITTNFGAKDSLPSGNAGKVIKGSEFTTEFTNIQTAVNTKADTAGDTFTGVVNFSDDIAVNTNTLFVDVSTAKVGIGTTTPDQKLQVDGNIRLGDTATGVDDDEDYGLRTGGSLTLHANDSGNNTFNTALAFDVGNASGAQAASSKIQFRVNNTERLRIDSSGNVGIGTNNPQRKLHVESEVRIQGTYPKLEFHDTDNNPKFTLIGGNAQFQIYDETNTATRMSVSASGNVGIGTTSPTGKLQIEGDFEATKALVLTNTKGAGKVSYIRSHGVDGEGLSLYHDGQRRQVWDSRGYISFEGTDGAEDMRIDSSGNVGIGTSSPTGSFTKTLHIHGSNTGASLHLTDPTSGATVTDGLEVFQYGSNGYVWEREAGDLRFGTSALERMRIDSSGNLLVGTTDSSGNLLVGTTDVVALNGGFSVTTGSVDYINVGHASSVASGNYYAAFRHGTNTIGTITQNGTTGVLYNTSSDERLKENITDSADAGSKVDAIQIRQFDWKADGSHQDYGVIAQELVTVAPEAVHQPVDEEDMMGVDYSKLVPMLIKEVQSLRSRVAELESE
jgi:hypothetical protein